MYNIPEKQVALRRENRFQETFFFPKTPSESVRRPDFQFYGKNKGAFNQDIDLNDRRLSAGPHAFPSPAYGFVGRDSDISEVEKRLSRCSQLLIMGMGGVGKTTLLHHLGALWKTTRFVDQAFYFSYDHKVRNRRQIMMEIAERIFSPPEFARNFQPVCEEARQLMLCKKLRAKRHLVILDNAEPLADGNLPAENTLSETEQEEIRQFLNQLSDGKTIVLSGSETGMGQGDHYELSGLDSESAAILAERILKQHNAASYLGTPDFEKLLSLLQGCPLALENILPNLESETPGNILRTLEAEDINLNKGDVETKNESIFRCIGYAHSSLFPQAQELLNCLAPFTSVINIDGLERYVRQLKRQPSLAHLPFDLWPEMIEGAVSRGLLLPHHRIPAFLQVQTTFPYFLKNRLRAPEQEKKRNAIETAFRKYYDGLSGAARHLMESDKANENKLRQILIEPEYENLLTALKFSLDARVSVINIYTVLSFYPDNGKHELGLELGNMVLEKLEDYSEEELKGRLGIEFVGIIDDIAKRRLLLGQYSEAELAYKKALAIWLENKEYDADQIRRRSSSFYHQLGRVAQEQCQWEKSQKYFLKDLQIAFEYNDKQGMNVTLRNLFRLWKVIGNQDIPKAVAKVLNVNP
ncbi:NB-ARC domain-containing protein [Desulfococcaceae bacterium HSG8]|nr:NB-ARC domain-containing protein [Desulfococcaceae bacterium HSG8]